jgi:hypothetical protein
LSLLLYLIGRRKQDRFPVTRSAYDYNDTTPAVRSGCPTGSHSRDSILLILREILKTSGRKHNILILRKYAALHRYPAFRTRPQVSAIIIPYRLLPSNVYLRSRIYDVTLPSRLLKTCEKIHTLRTYPFLQKKNPVSYLPDVRGFGFIIFMDSATNRQQMGNCRLQRKIALPCSSFSILRIPNFLPKDANK